MYKALRQLAWRSQSQRKARRPLEPIRAIEMDDGMSGLTRLGLFTYVCEQYPTHVLDIE
jgi:hypothetical protein